MRAILRARNQYENVVIKETRRIVLLVTNPKPTSQSALGLVIPPMARALADAAIEQADILALHESDTTIRTPPGDG